MCINIFYIESTCSYNLPPSFGSAKTEESILNEGMNVHKIFLDTYIHNHGILFSYLYWLPGSAVKGFIPAVSRKIYRILKSEETKKSSYIQLCTT